MKVKVITESSKEKFESELNKALKDINEYSDIKFSTCNTTQWIFYIAIIIYQSNGK